ncbi:MAG: DUF3179 domain-containing protein, partial [Planctomycetota bacterium]
SGFTGWKGRLLSVIDPGFGRFLDDGWPARIRVEEILWGGVRVDGIPALNNPKMISKELAFYLQPNDPVFGISINNDARAYPLRIMDGHEMANDVVGGVPVSLAYCTLCGSGIAYEGRASDGKIYTFGSSGLLYRSNKLMYDRQTRTLWTQFTGKPVLGKLADGDVKLKLLPVVVTTWQQWRKQHPHSKVLDINTGYKRDYSSGSFYADYFASGKTMFPVWQRNKKLPTKARIYGLTIEGVDKAYPIRILAGKGVVNDKIGETDVVIVATRGEVIVKGRRLRGGSYAYSSGAEVRVYRGEGLKFVPGPEPSVLVDNKGGRWRVTEEGLMGPGGRRLSRINGFLAYWFAWYAFHPGTLVYKL